MGLSDELSAIMRAHDDDAPTVDDLPARPWAGAATPPVSRRRAVLLPLAAAAAVLMIVAGAVAITRTRDDATTAAGPSSPPTSVVAAGPLRCPASYAGLDDESTPSWVPASPSGVDLAGRLVPDITPVRAIVCGYTGGAPVDGRPSRGPQKVSHREITGGLVDLRESLTWLPPVDASQFCGGTGLPTDDSAALVGLTYPGSGTVWVGVPGHDCATFTNGVTRTAGMYTSAAIAVRTGRWPAPAKNSGSCGGTTGRFGQQNSLVPATSRSAVICTMVQRTVVGATTVSTTKQTVVTGAAVRELAVALNRLETRSPTQTCSESNGLGRARYTVRFDYAVGPSVVLMLAEGNTCFGDITNGSLTSSSSASVLPLLDQLTR